MTAELSTNPMRLSGAVTLEREPDGLVLCLTGEVDAAVVDRFTADPDHQPVPVAAIDAGAVTFISSAGVALMLRWAGATRSWRVTGDTLVLSDGTRTLARFTAQHML